MENPPASKCPATNRSDDIQDPLHNDIRLGGKWEYQQLREGSSYCKWLELVGFSFSLIIFIPDSFQFA